jgi:nicotinate-nucleotide pyrophosphorylase (carboxylating)
MRALESRGATAGPGIIETGCIYGRGEGQSSRRALGAGDLQASISKVKSERRLPRCQADTVEQVRQFVALEGVDVILLDNMTVPELRAAVALRKPGLFFEASGGVTLKTVRQIAETGVDFISVGEMTHSAPAVDFSLEIGP